MEEETEEEFKENETDTISKELRTMIPADIHIMLTDYAKAVAKTGLGKWDYGVAIRLLLEKARTYDMIAALWSEVNELKELIHSQGSFDENSVVKTFGGDVNVK